MPAASTCLPALLTGVALYYGAVSLKKFPSALRTSLGSDGFITAKQVSTTCTTSKLVYVERLEGLRVQVGC